MIVTCSDLIHTIEEHLSGRLTASAMARWALTRFYALEQGEATLTPGDEGRISAALDDLMFADEESFALDDADLRRLIAQLTPL